MRARRVGKICILILIAVWGVTPCYGEVTAEDVMAAWTARENDVRSLRIRWTGSEFYDRGSLGVPIPNEPVVPDAPATMKDMQVDLLLSGSHMRYSTKIPQVDRGTVSMLDYVSSYDGESSRTLIKKDPGGWHARIHPQSRNPDVGTLSLVPLFLSIRGTRPVYGGVRQDKLVLRERTVFDGQPALMVEFEQMRLWLNIYQNFTVMRWQSLHSRTGAVTTQADIRYQEDATIGWLPKSWTITSYDNRKQLIRACEATVTEYEMNPAIDQEAFQLTFPAGAPVYDAKTDTYGVSTEDGTIRPISAEEYRERVQQKGDFLGA